MDDYSSELDRETGMYCIMSLFTRVENIAELHKKVTSGELCCCILKATLIVDPFQVLVAANKAALNATLNQLITKRLHTEVLFYLSTSKNISKALSEFGMGEKDTDILVVTIQKNDTENLTSHKIIDSIKGEKIPITRLKEFTNLELVRQVYKIDNEESRVSNLIDSIVSRISCKDFASLK